MRQSHKIYNYTFVQCDDFVYDGRDIWQVYKHGHRDAIVRYTLFSNANGGKITARYADSATQFYYRELYGRYHNRINESWEIYLGEISMALDKFLRTGIVTNCETLGNNNSNYQNCEYGLPEIGW